MTSKIQFIKSATVAFNCTPFTVLASITGRNQTKMAKAIRSAAKNSVQQPISVWRKFAKQAGRGNTINSLAFGTVPEQLPLP